MSLNELFLAGAKPKRITLLTSGTGTYVPTEDDARCLFRIQAPGGGGAGCSGGAGAFMDVWLRVPIAGVPWVVGAAGVGAITIGTATSGSNSRVGSFTVAGGGGGSYLNGNNYYGGNGGRGPGSNYSTSSVNATVSASTLPVIPGGAGGFDATGGWGVGQPLGYYMAGAVVAQYPSHGFHAFSTVSGTYAGGGDSYMGIGGAGSATIGGNGNGYGSGGGAGGTNGGNGAPGITEVWDFGA